MISILKEELEGFLLLPENWDSYGGHRFSEELINKAKEMSDCLFGDGWIVLPCPGGSSVQFEKRDDWCEIDIYVEDMRADK